MQPTGGGALACRRPVRQPAHGAGAAAAAAGVRAGEGAVVGRVAWCHGGCNPRPAPRCSNGISHPWSPSTAEPRPFWTIWQEGGDQLARGGRARRRTGRGTLSIWECRPTRSIRFAPGRAAGFRSWEVNQAGFRLIAGRTSLEILCTTTEVQLSEYHAATWPPAAFFDTWTSSLAKAPIRMHVAVRALGTPPEP